MHWNYNAYDKHSYAMHWDCIAYDEHSCAMHLDCIMISIIVQCNRKKLAMHWS